MKFIMRIHVQIKQEFEVIWQLYVFGCLLLFYVLATSKVISGWQPTCESAHVWWFYCAASLRDQSMTRCPTLSHYPNTVLTSLGPILIMPSARLDSDKYQFDKLLFDSNGFRTPYLPHGKMVFYRFGDNVAFVNYIKCTYYNSLNTCTIYCIYYNCTYAYGI